MSMKDIICGAIAITLTLLFSTVAVLTPSTTWGEEAAFDKLTHTIFGEYASSTG